LLNFFRYFSKTVFYVHILMILSNTRTSNIKLPIVVHDNFCFNLYLHNISLLRFVNFEAYTPPTIKSLMRRRASDGLGAITASQIARANPSVARARVLAFVRASVPRGARSGQPLLWNSASLFLREVTSETSLFAGPSHLLHTTAVYATI